MNLNLFLINEHATLRDALEKISANKYGMILAINQDNEVVGLATDGDIRDKILLGIGLEDSISLCVSPNFVWADLTTPRETILKLLDRNIRVIPVLNSARKLVGIFSRENFPILLEERTYVRSRAPVRVSFGGGGSDLTNFFEGEEGAVINATIALFTHATLRIRNDKHIVIYSQDLNEQFEASNLQSALKQNGNFGLVQALLKAIQPTFGFELYLHSDFPMRSGLGGSAVVAAAILGCFNQLRQDRWDSHELAELAFQAERLYFGIGGGWQDQYATVFGGFNFMEFRMDQNIVHPLRINSEVLLELEESLVLCDTGIPHNSGAIHMDQREQLKKENIRELVQSNVEITYLMRNHLLRGRLNEFGQLLDRSWQLKRQFSSKISSNQLDKIYESAIAHGALGGKLLGAGGGGFFLFYVPPFDKFRLTNKLKAEGLKIQAFQFEYNGMRAWSVREKAEISKVDI